VSSTRNNLEQQLSVAWKLLISKSRAKIDLFEKNTDDGAHESFEFVFKPFVTIVICEISIVFFFFFGFL
jgi:hypothetical protein